MAEKQSNKDRIKEITAGIEQGIKELFESDRYRNYLVTMSRFHKYSVNNVMLIHMQRPDATLVAGFNKWRDQFGRNVMKGEKGIKIIAPAPYKKKIEEMKLDPDTKAPVLDKDGNAIIEEKEIRIPMFKVATVFDVSQTEGRPLPQLASDLTGNVQQYEIFVEALRRTSPVPIEFKPITPDTDGFLSLTNQTITIREGMSEVQTVCAAIHEIAHAKLHNTGTPIPENAPVYQEVEIFDIPALFSNGRIPSADIPEGLFRYDLRGSDDDPGMPIAVEENVLVNHAGAILTAKPLSLPEEGRLMFTEDDGLNFVGGEITAYQFREEQKKDRQTEEVEAESISYTVCQYYGIETSENSFGYVANWSKGKDLKVLRESLETINRTSSDLITEIDRHFDAICKERGISRESEIVEYETVYPHAIPETIAAFSHDFADFMMDAHNEYPFIALPADSADGIVAWTMEKLENHKFSAVRYAFPDTTAESDDEPDMFSEAFYAKYDNLTARLQEMGKKEYVRKEPTLPETVSSDTPAFNREEALYLVDDTVYLHVQPTDGGYDYSLYDKASMKLTDGGMIDIADIEASPVSSLLGAVRTEVFAVQGMTPTKVTAEDLALLEQLQAAQTEVAAETMLPETPEQTMDEPLPDPTLTVSMMEHYGYTDHDMLPLSKDRAVELMERDITVYVLYDDNTEAMVFETEDILKHDGMFGITREDWDAVKADIPLRDVEQRFLNSPTDSMAIYQLRRDAPVELRFTGLDSLKAAPDPANYEAVYTREVYPDENTSRILENFYYIFNEERPGDFVGHSLSVSDIIALKQDGKVSYHYCDSFGFKELPTFQRPENYLKAAEMSMEDDYGMIDGVINNGKAPSVADLEAQVKAGQSISLLDLAEAVKRENKAKKPSVLEQLKSQSPQEHTHKSTPKRSTEREI
ncbi:MAG: DUF4316 domain-containing protein [Clostridia bacterium]|nr:DUF4316 domain-containing protein [Clostridia bacterium]